ncbi:MAG: serine hydrolase [Pseudomonadota bacterium]
MRIALRIIALLFVAVLAFALIYVRSAASVAVGYSAKQLCSGVFVAGLPASFIEERDIAPRMAVLGPLLPLLHLEVDAEAGFSEARLLGVSARAVHSSATGCVLHGTGAGLPPLPNPELNSDAVPVPELLQSAFDDAFAEPSGGGRNTLALLVLHDGSLIAERYSGPVTAQTRMQGWSMNKSLVATWIGLLSQQDAFEPARTLGDLWAGDAEAPELDGRISVLHLLQMESGIGFEERYGPGSDATRMLYQSKAMWRTVASSKQARVPGSHFSYSSGDTVLASYFWQRSLAQSYPDWIRQNFSEPLGIRSLVAEADASGMQVGSSYAYMTARDWLRVGALWLDAWHGRSAQLSKEWLRSSVSARDSDPSGRYGRGFWLNTNGVRHPGLPENLFAASGNAGQSITVLPEWNIVVVRLGLSSPGVDLGMTQFLQHLAELKDQLP